MGFRANGYQQLGLNDRLINLTERERRILDASWAKPFAEKIFPRIDESRFDVLYCSDNGRPNTPVNVIIGALILKELMRDTDEELLDEVTFDSRYQYALHLTSYDEIPFSDRTVSRFRERLYLHELDTGEDLLKGEIEHLASEFSKMMKINGKLKRMDSAMVSSNCKKMGRLELMYTCVANMVKAIVSAGESSVLPKHLLEYTKENKNSVCYRLDSDEVLARQEEVAKDAMELYKIAMHMQYGRDELRLLERLLADQTDNGVLKKGKAIQPDSLQNPSDEDATFRRKAGKEHHGYVVNVVEDCGDTKNIITHYDYDVNRHSDIAFADDAIAKLGIQKEQVVIIADGGYASAANFESAKKNNIELIATNLTGEKPPSIITEFHIGENSCIVCPEGCTSGSSNYSEAKGQFRAHFDKATCECCSRCQECPVALQKKTSLLTLSQATIERARYAAKLSTEEYKEYARKRNGVEGIPSILRRRYGIDRIPVRGLLRTKVWIGFKIGAINVKRVIAATLESRKVCTDAIVNGETLLDKIFTKLSVYTFARTCCKSGLLTH